MVALEAPRVEVYPAPSVSSFAPAAVELADRCGLGLDPWQQHVIDRSLGVDDRGLFTAPEVGVNVARQNGKGVILEVRELVGIFEVGEKLITHSSHQQDTSLEAMRRLVEALEEGGLHKELKERGGVRNTNGQEALVFRTGQRIRFRTRSKGAGRGFSCDCLILDEAMFLAEYAHAALMPSLSAMPNPQIWYTGSAVDQEVHEHGVVWARIRERGIAEDDRLAYFEWAAEYDKPEDVPAVLSEKDVSDPNPALGIRITREWIDTERKSMNPREFAVERLGVGDWPRTDGVLQQVVPIEQWKALADEDSEMLDPIVLAFDVGPDRTGCIAAAGKRPDGLWHVEIVDHRTGTGWLAKAIHDYVRRQAPAAVVCDAYGPVGSIVQAVENYDVELVTVTAAEHAAACGRLADAVADKTLRHLGTEELQAAIRGAKPRPLGDAWAWSRKSSSVDISPLVAVTLALSAAMDLPEGEMRIW